MATTTGGYVHVTARWHHTDCPGPTYRLLLRAYRERGIGGLFGLLDRIWEKE